MTQLVSINEPKVFAFEYVLKNLVSWHEEATGQSENNDLSTLKSIKLLFFVTAVKAHRGGPNFLLNNVFNEYVAMPYGHVESDIYNEIRKRKGVLNFFEINNSKTSLIAGKDISELNQHVNLTTRNEIDFSVDELKKKNFSLITLSAFELVDLSHSWYSWKKTFSRAKMSGINSEIISSEDIIQEDKNFSLQLF